jgi:hypothetical protein
MSGSGTAELDREVRKFVLDFFIESGHPPVLEEIQRRFRIPAPDGEAALDRLQTAHQIQLVPGTHRILMAFPLSAVATPYTVTLPSGRRYFANCAWDALATHIMLKEPATVHSYCHYCSEPIRIALRGGHIDPPSDRPPVVYLGLPAKQWWNNIVVTCGNTMVFFDSEEHHARWRAERPEESGRTVSVETMLRLSEALYATKLDFDFVRPSAEQLSSVYASLGLEGPFWEP